MAKIEKKIWPKNFEDVLSGKKTYEPRLCNFKIGPGDTYVLREWDPKRGKYTGRKITKKVAAVLQLSPTELRKYWTPDQIEEHGLQVIQFEQILFK
jgi:hypothetical protein